MALKRSLGVAIAVLCLVPAILAQPGPLKPIVKPHVRKNINTFTATQITALRTAVKTMQARQPTDPTSWVYQANMHGSYDMPAQTAWNTCQHGSYLFLSWHRMYLYYFERILRKASGDPTLSLPYWNYSQAASRALPAAFRSPATAANPLFVSQRSAAMNAGALLPPSSTSFATAFSRIDFASNTSGSSSFGGLRVPGPVHFSGGGGALELSPHNAVHVQVGGNAGWMSDPNVAARDPIFWLHHCNVDRLWESWLKLGGGRLNPPATDKLWMATVFTFFDENGAAVKMTAADVLETATQLQYQYDALSTVASPIAVTGGTGAGGAQPQTAATTDKPVTVAGKPVQVSLPLTGDAAKRVTSAISATTAGAIRVKLEDVTYDQGSYLEIYVNLPAGAPAAGPSSPYYAGLFAPFEPKDHQTRDFEVDVSDAVRGLNAKKLMKTDAIAITLVPVAPESKGPGVAAAGPPSFKVQIGKLSVLTGQ